MASSMKRNHLSLEVKVKVIKEAQKHPGISVRTLGETFNCGKTQISEILKKKDSIMALYESNASSSKKPRVSEFSTINESLYQWYLMACSKNIYPGGPQLAEKAREIAARLGKSEFKGTNGWLSKWKKRYNIKRVAVCGEAGDVRGETVTSWKERLPEILRGYAKEDIYNLDETGCFWKALPDKGFAQKGMQCKGGKKSKQRFTVAFLVNAAGEKETPIVIWKSEKPRCFRGFDKNSLPVKYYHQTKAWMTGEILDSFLTTFNHKMKLKSRRILLLMDNAGCHPEHLKEKYSNIKIVFLPANTTSKLQPLDLGIIMNFKTHYRRLLLRYVLAKIDSCSCATEVVKSVNVLTAIRWVALAWREVNKETIKKCFKSGGVLNSAMDVSIISQEEDPFQDIDDNLELHTLISRTMGNDICSVEEYVNGDSDLPVCVDIDDETWQENFLESLDADVAIEEEDEEDEEEDVLPPPPKIKSHKEAVQSLDDLKNYFESHDCFEEATSVSSLIDRVACHISKSVTQTTLHDYVIS